MVSVWILNVFLKEIVYSVLFTNSGREMWTELEERLDQSSGINLF